MWGGWGKRLLQAQCRVRREVVSSRQFVLHPSVRSWVLLDGEISPVLTSKTTEGRLSWAPRASTNVHSSPAPALYYINHLCKARCSPERSHIIANCFINKISWEIRTAARYSTKIDLQSGKIKPLGTACTWGEKKKKLILRSPSFDIS